MGLLKRNPKQYFEHIYHPLHLFCRLRDAGLSIGEARDIAEHYEKDIYVEAHKRLGGDKVIMTRRSFLGIAKGAFYLALAGSGWLSYAQTAHNYRERKNLESVMFELPKHVYVAETTIKMAEEDEARVIRGCGIIVGKQYITMAHITHNVKRYAQTPFGILEGEDGTVESKVVKVNGVSLEELVCDTEEDVAVYDARDLGLPDFPALPGPMPKLGTEVYIIGNPRLSGTNIRNGIVSDSDGLEGEGSQHTNGCFGISVSLIGGDSGSPVVTKDCELVGLARAGMTGCGGYVNPIAKYLR